MFPNIEYHESAFKHGVTESSISYALWHPLHEQQLEAYKNKWLVIGYDTVGNLLEIVYNIIDDDTVNVFHAMRCRKKFINKLDLWEKKMARMTEEEANALDEEITNADITLEQGKGGIFTRQRELLDALDRASADYIMTRALSTDKMPVQILSEMVHAHIIQNAVSPLVERT